MVYSRYNHSYWMFHGVYKPTGLTGDGCFHSHGGSWGYPKRLGLCNGKSDLEMDDDGGYPF